MTKTLSIFCITSMFSIALPNLYAQTTAAIPAPSTGSTTSNWFSAHATSYEGTNINNFQELKKNKYNTNGEKYELYIT